LEDIVIVGHSIGGMTLPGVVTKLGAARVREMIFAAAFLPPEGASIVDGLPWLLANRPALRKGRRAARNAKMASAIRVLERSSFASPPIHGRQALCGITSHPRGEFLSARYA
jgi:hypothetical protein